MEEFWKNIAKIFLLSIKRHLLKYFCFFLKHCFWHFSVFAAVVVYLRCDQQVRDSDSKDPKRERIVELIDDFRISGANGERILCI